MRAGEARRLLRYLVETEQAGRAEDLREVQIASALYGREPSYDPKLDGIVRVSATRLRVRLEEHYTRHPSALRILLPVGSYVPYYEQTMLAQGEADVDPPQGPEGSGSPVVVSGESGEFVVRPETAHNSSKSTPTLWLAALGTAVALLIVGVLFLTRSSQSASRTAWVARPFSRLGGVQQFPAFSPDGRSVVFAWTRSPGGSPTLYLQDLTSDLPHSVTGQHRGETRPAWSPDGSRLAFVQADDSGPRHILIRSMASGVETLLASLPDHVPWLCGTPRVSWSPDGRDLFTAAAFPETIGAKDPGPRCGIVAIHVADGSIRPLTHAPAGSLGDLEPVVSPDGRTVAFVRSISYGVDDVYTVPAGGGPVARITSDNREVQGVQWRPDGKALILAARADDGVMRLMERDLRTERVTMLTDGIAPAAFPALSPDGRRLVFTSYRKPTIIDRAFPGGTATLLADESHNASPRLSFDGKKLAFSSERSGFSEIWIGNADGSDGVRLTHSGGTGAHVPSWFPDGQTILFECRDQQHAQICTMPTDGSGGVKRVTTEDADHVLPTLSRDGRFVYYLSNRSGRQEAYRQGIGGGEPTQLSVGGAAGVMESWDGRSLYLESLKDGAGFLHIPVGHETVETAAATESNRLYLVPALKALQGGPWTTAPGGMIFYLKAAHPDKLMLFEEATGSERVFAGIDPGEQPNLLSMAPDGLSVLYSTLGKISGELDMLTAPAP